MNQQQALAMVRDTFTQPFDRDRYLGFISNLLNHIDESKSIICNRQYVKDAFKPHVNRYERLATYTAPDDRKLDILIVYLTGEEKLTRARTALRNFAADFLKQRDHKDAALVAFVSPSESVWRFSYVKMEYATVEKSSGVIDAEAQLTPAKRFSYLVGPAESCHTAQSRFLELLQDTQTSPHLADIQEAFSVEAVTKEFFQAYKRLFFEVLGELDKLVQADRTIADDFATRKVNTADFAKKLMGQIVFLYFLQKKGWLGVPKDGAWGDGPHNFLRKLADGEYDQHDNLFNDTLEPLFYDTLATDRGHEAFCPRFTCRIPFLNGGLFEPLNGYDWRKTEILLPNRLFTNNDAVEEGITGTGILDIFDRYNFTVNEAEPLEKEVAIDPEMLGKVFENLLEVKERKSKGSFYTPREIVHYMCQESLINYLDTAMNGVEGDTDIPVCIPTSEIHKTNRNLPHWTREGSVYWITFRLADSLPQEKLTAWRAERECWLNQHPHPWSEEEWKEYDESLGERLQSWLDAGYGSCALMRPDVRQIMQDCLLRFDGERLRLHNAVIMPNHVHLLLEPLAGNELAELLKGIKGASARKANQILGNTGTAFWMDESYDHIVRSERQRQHFIRYIAENPVKAKLAAGQFWLHQGDTGIPACITPETPGQGEDTQTGMSMLPLPQTQTGMSVPRCDIETLVHLGDQISHYEAVEAVYRVKMPKSIGAHARALDEKLAAITVCDPAIGSGAFPVGMMQEIVRARSALTPYFNDVNDRTAYHFKRHAIQNCLYGVDIDPGAVEIAKLRLWLSLVVDEEDVQQIKPLPNLDYKVVVGNSLLGFPFRSERSRRIEGLKAQFFGETDQGAKVRLKAEIDGQLSQAFANSKRSLGYEVNFDFQTVFSEIFDGNNGFDVVIGNPPYLFARNSKEKGMTAADKKIYNENYKLAEYQLNLYPLFIEKGTGLLRDQGSFAFITPNNWLTINTNALLRRFVLSQSEVTIVNFYARVFASADVDSSIIIYKRSARNRRIRLFEYTNHMEFVSESDCEIFLQQHDSIINIGAQKGDRLAGLIQKIEARADRLREVADVKVGLGAYGLGRGIPPQTEMMIRNRIYHSTRKTSPEHHKYVDGRDVCRYLIGWSGEFLQYGDHLREPRKDWSLFSSKRILVRQIPATPPYCIHACLVEEALLNDRNSMNVINLRESAELVLGILNSRLTSFWFVHKFGKLQRQTFPQFKANELKEFPLPRGREQKKDDIIRLVNTIQAAKRTDPDADTSALDREIDQIVYNLYGLTPEEIAIVESATVPKAKKRTQGGDP